MSVNLRVHIFFGWVFQPNDPARPKVDDLVYEDNDLQEANEIRCHSEDEDLVLYVSESSIYGVDRPISGPLFERPHHRLVTDPSWTQRLQSLNGRLQLGITTAPDWHVGWEYG